MDSHHTIYGFISETAASEMCEVCDLYASCNKMLHYAPKEFAKYSQFVLYDRPVSTMASTFHVKCVIFVNHFVCMLYVRANKCMRLGVRECVRACVRAFVRASSSS